MTDPDVALKILGPCETYETNENGHRTWDPHVFGYFHELKYAEDGFAQSFYNLVDALMAGDDYFECTNEKAYYWCTGARLIDRFFPPATDCIERCEDPDHFVNGKGKIVLKVSKEYLAERIRNFEKLVTDAINDAVSDDYTEFEAELSLFDYIARNWVYDHEEYNLHNDEFDKDPVYRCFTERKGICWEISTVYIYLLSQCGIKADGISGTMTDEGHEWTGLELDGKWYMADVTWALTTKKPDLQYFLFSEDMRIAHGLVPDSLSVAGWYGESYTLYGINMDNRDREPLWFYKYYGMNRENGSVILRNFMDEFSAVQYR
jgi:hypothetical protein